jgi:putative flippase GtrA
MTFARYLGSVAFAWALYLALCELLLMAMPLAGAITLAFAASMLASFAIRRSWVFGSTEASVHGQLTRALVLNVIVYVAQLALAAAALQAGASQASAVPLTMLVLVPASYVAARRWAFA